MKEPIDGNFNVTRRSVDKEPREVMDPGEDKSEMVENHFLTNLINE